VSVDDGYQVRIGRRAGLPRNVVDLFALTVVVEQRALRRYQEHLGRVGVDEETREVLQQVTKDEGWHLDWMRKKGRELAERAGEPARFDESVKRFREIDREVMEELNALEQSFS
jgi:rubrerythrin